MFEIHMWFLEAKVDAKTKSEGGRKAGRGKRKLMTATVKQRKTGVRKCYLETRE
jgi:hypothetical protein